MCKLSGAQSKHSNVCGGWRGGTCELACLCVCVLRMVFPDKLFRCINIFFIKRKYMYIMNSLLSDRAKFHCATPITSDQTHYPSKYIFHHSSQQHEHSNFNKRRVKTHKTLIRIFYERKNKNKTNKKTHISCIPFGNKQSTNKR